jgi:hypothetical protein
VPIVPTVVKEEVIIPEANVVPVSVPAAAATVQVEPRVQVWPLTVVAGFARSALVTRPVAVNAVVTVKLGAVRPLGNVVEIDGTPPFVTSTPLFAVAISPTLPPVVWNKMSFDAPFVIEVAPAASMLVVTTDPL